MWRARPVFISSTFADIHASYGRCTEIFIYPPSSRLHRSKFSCACFSRPSISRNLATFGPCSRISTARRYAALAFDIAVDELGWNIITSPQAISTSGSFGYFRTASRIILLASSYLSHSARARALNAMADICPFRICAKTEHQCSTAVRSLSRALCSIRRQMAKLFSGSIARTRV